MMDIIVYKRMLIFIIIFYQLNRFKIFPKYNCSTQILLCNKSIENVFRPMSMCADTKILLPFVMPTRKVTLNINLV